MFVHLRQVVLMIHILLSIIWFGGILFVGWGVYPATKKMTFKNQRLFLIALMKHTHKLFSLAGIGVIFTGVILGTKLGPIHEWSDLLHTNYGKLFLTAFLIAVGSLFWGMFVSYKSTMHMLLNDQIWSYAENGGTEPLRRAMRHTTIVTAIEVVGLTSLVIIMVLL